MAMIQVTNRTRMGELSNVYINPAYITRISVAFNSPGGETVIEISGSEFSTWCVETPAEVVELIRAASPEPVVTKVAKPKTKPDAA